MLRVTTESGTIYEFESGRVRRQADGASRPLRRDSEWLSLEAGTIPTVGNPLVMRLEPLGGGDVTWRRTSPVADIEGEEPTGSPEMPEDEARRVRAAMGDYWTVSPL